MLLEAMAAPPVRLTKHCNIKHRFHVMLLKWANLNLKNKHSFHVIIIETY